MCYRDSWQHHGPAFAAWPAIVFLVSLQSIARSILPRSSTTSFAASYFTGAQHGVARYLGNFAERGCSLCQQPVPRRQRIRRSPRRSCPRGLIFLLLPSLAFPSARITRSRERASSSYIRIHHRRSCCPIAAIPPFSPHSHPPRPRRSAGAACFAPLSVVALVWRSRISRVHVSTSHRAHRVEHEPDAKS